MPKSRKPAPPESERTRQGSGLDLSALFEFSTVVSSSLDLKFILGHFLLTLMSKLLSSRGVIMLRKDGHLFAVEQVKGLPQEMVDRKSTRLNSSHIPLS